MKHGVKLESLNWVEAERFISTRPVVVVPPGAAAKQHGEGLWSPSGVYGQATLASADKGRIIAEHQLQHCLQGIDACKNRR